MSRPTMRFVSMKTAEQQATLMLVGVRDRLIRNRTQLANAIRGHAAEFGLAATKGMAHLIPLLERIQADESLPALAREFVRHAGRGIWANVGANRRDRCQAHRLASGR
jgi:transposase